MNASTLSGDLARYRPAATSAAPLALPEPTLPETSAYGGINLNHLTTGDRSVTLQAGPYDAFLPGDRLDVYWDGASSPIASAPVTQRGLYAYVDIPGEAIMLAGAGRKEFSFVLTSGVGGGTLPSDPASVLVDIDVPGDPDPGTDPVNPKLPAPTVVPLLIDAAQAALGATVTVPPWTSMAVDDVLSVYWGTVPVKVTNPPVGQPVVVTIDSATILAAGDSPTLPVNYDIVDAVGNYSKRSPSTAVNVQAGTTFFIAPKVLEAPTNVLDLDQLAGANVQVQVDPEQEGIALGDTVVLTWKGLTSEGVVVPPLTYSQKVEAVTYMVFPILNADAVALAQGSALIYYEINGRKSRDRQISIIGEGQALAAPLVQEAGGGVLDPAQLIDGAHLQIDPYSVMRLGDTVTYYWTGKLLGSTASMLSGTVPVTGNDLNPPKPLIFTVPKAEVEALVGGTIEVYYTVDTYTRALLAPSATLLLSVTGMVALPPPAVDHVIGGILDPADASFGTNVRVETTYPGATKGDVVRVFWNGNGSANSYSNTFAVTPGVLVVCPIASGYVTGNENVTVSASYQVERGGQSVGQGDPLLFLVSGEVGELPAPIVHNASNGALNPIDALGGARIQVSYAGMREDDVVAISWDGNNAYPTLPGSSSGEVIFTIPPNDVRPTIGKTVPVFYTVRRAGASTDSGLLSLRVDPLPESSLSPIEIEEATEGEVDLGGVPVDADVHVHVAPWPFIATAETLWLRVTGTNFDGSPYELIVWNNIHPSVTDVATGPRGVIPRADLQNLTPGCELTLQMKVSHDGGDAENAGQAFVTGIFRTRQPFWDHTGFNDYNLNGWLQGPAGVGAYAGIVNVNGAYSYRNRTRGNEGSYAGVILTKSFDGLVPGRRYRIVFHFINLHENNSQHPIISVTVDGVAIMEARTIVETGWIPIDNYFVAPSSQLSIDINNHQPRGDAGNDYEIDNIFVVEQVG